ncbi:MAG: N-formylglutamate deformylase [Pseudooceanicola nanhaiensis]
MIDVQRGSGPIVLGLPHTGTDVPDDIRANLNDRGRELSDTDWHIHDLYAGLLDDATTVRTPIHRYVIDVNRPPDGESLYPGQNTTGLVPLTDFDGHPIWETPPDGAEIERRREAYHAPYHAALEAELDRVKAAHGVAVLFDCHSIRSVIPYLFEGTLPDFNIGTDSGRTCAPAIEAGTLRVASEAEGYTHVLNGRFKGGWTTRHYGRPQTGLHAIQLELAQSTYMAETPPWTWDDAKASRLHTHLKDILNTLRDLALKGDLT